MSERVPEVVSLAPESVAEDLMESGRFRQVLGHLPTCVAVVTAMSDGAPVGMTIGSFLSVSLSPAMVGFFPVTRSSTWARIRSAEAFASNVLAVGQEWLSQRFATPGEDRFDSVRWTPGVTGAPLLTGAAALVECEIESVTPAGDHDFVLGRVVRLDANFNAHPTVFHRGQYSALADNRLLAMGWVSGYPPGLF